MVAPVFLGWLSVPSAGRWLEVGSGTGELTRVILSGCDPASVLGVDPSAELIESARDVVRDDRVRFEVGGAEELPIDAEGFDAVVSGLVLNFIPDVDAGIAGMVRAAKPGGMVAAYVWDYAGEMQIMRRFWDVAVELDPEAARFDEGLREPPLCEPDALTAHFKVAGLVDVKVRSIDVPAHFVDFDDYWAPFTGGQGSAPTYVMSLDEGARAVLREAVRNALPVGVDGAIDLIARAWAVFATRALSAGR